MPRKLKNRARKATRLDARIWELLKDNDHFESSQAGDEDAFFAVVWLRHSVRF
jgi:hypothetical protein